MVDPSRLYGEAEAKGRTLISLLQQRLDIPAAHDIERASVELNYRLDSDALFDNHDTMMDGIAQRLAPQDHQ